VPRTYPALEIHGPSLFSEDDVERLLAALDDAGPLAVEERDGGEVRVFFATAADRVRGERLVAQFDATLRCFSIEVSDEDWARRSQIGLGPVRVGQIVIVQHDATDTYLTDLTDAPPGVITISIPPSMGFGTGHHASTRRCLELLQRISISGARVLDAGTGSGILAIAAWRLGAREVVAGDCDPDALEAAGENLERNNATKAITLALVDLGNLSTAAPQVRGPFDLILANITGSALIRYAPTLVSLLSKPGRLIASGFQQDEVAAVIDAFSLTGLTLADRSDEESWVGIVLHTPR
jgi:ribosomal protein L11 methyltransferase